jgi:hypothetical protein
MIIVIADDDDESTSSDDDPAYFQQLHATILAYQLPLLPLIYVI